jgi:hypothetical protein
VLVGGSDSDDTVRAQHFELEIGVVGNRHESSIEGAPKNGVVCPMESNHLQSESFLPEVGGSTEADRQVDPLDGLCSFSQDNSMEAPDTGSKVRPCDSQKVEGLDVNNVENVASVYEHLGEACVGDDGIDDEWVDSRIGDVIWVVIIIKSNGHLRPVKEEGSRVARRRPLDVPVYAAMLRDTSRVLRIS